MALDLPGGRRGRALALGLGLIAIMLVWLAVIGPLLDWYSAGAAKLSEREMLARKMTEIAATIPKLEQQVKTLQADNHASGLLLAGESDTVAAANLQERVQTLAKLAGTTLSSVEILPVSQAGRFHRIGLRVAMQADMSKVVRLLDLLDESRPRILVSELDLERHPLIARPNGDDVDAKLVAYAFRAGDGVR